MTISRLKDKTMSSTLTSPFDIDLGAMIPIATATVGSGGSSAITFSSIPSTYEHLQVRGIARQGSAANGIGDIYIQFNGDSGSNFISHNLYGLVSAGGSGSVGAGYESSNTAGNISIGKIAGAAAGASMFGAVIIDILDYANTNKNKTVRSLSGTNQNTAESIIRFGSVLWNSTSAITSITIGGYGTTTMAEYSSFALYGIKRAGA